MELYDKIEPYNTGMLKVSNIHSIYYEECGNPNGKPIVYLHGGPGGSVAPDNRRLFDPKFYRIILFDQRGAGKSVPFACFEENTTDLLVEDIEVLRKHLNIDKWVVYGGSWGSTLALVYSIRYPQSVLGIILRGVFLARKDDADWLFREGGVSNIFPDKFEPYKNFVGEGDIVEQYYEIFKGDNEKLKFDAAQVWTRWEMEVVSILPPPPAEEPYSLAHAYFECHYVVNNFFIEENYILNNIEKIKHIPVEIIHARYDMDCRYNMAYSLHKALPKSNLNRVELAGHSIYDKGVGEAIVDATEKFKSLYS